MPKAAAPDEFPDDAWVRVSLSVRPGLAGRVDRFLAERLAGRSRSELQRWLRRGRVLVRGRPAKASRRVVEGEAVIVLFERRRDPPAARESLEVLYEDADLLAVLKPSGVLSHPTGKVRRNSATEILTRQFPGLRLWLVHRLDGGTSGVLLLAKTAEAARRLSLDFHDRKVKKEYLAVAAGRVGFRRRLARGALGRGSGPVRVRQTVREEGGKPAATLFERLAVWPGATLLKASPRSGRLHQIRAHLAWLGHPVLGDKVYTGSGELYLKAMADALDEGDRRALGAPRLMLHAWRLSLRHPATGAPLELKAPPPADFLAVLPREALKTL